MSSNVRGCCWIIPHLAPAPRRCPAVTRPLDCTLHITHYTWQSVATHYTWHHLLLIGTLQARCRGVPCIMSWDTKGALTNTAENLEFILKEWNLYFVFLKHYGRGPPLLLLAQMLHCFHNQPPPCSLQPSPAQLPPAPSCPLLYSAAFNGRISLRHVWRIVDIISVPSCLKTFQVTGAEHICVL